MLKKENPLAADQSEKGISKLPRRLERYATAHKRALLNADYIHTHHPRQTKRAHKLTHCGHFLMFRHYYTVDDLRLISADFCKQHLLCPLCAIRRGAKFLDRYLQRYEVIRAENRNLKPYLVTLTMKDGKNLGERINALKSALKRLTMARRNYLNLKNRPFVQFCHASGYVYSIEVKRGKNSGLWHPHVHMVWLCEEEPNNFELSKEWHSLTGDSYITDIRPIIEDDLASGFSEVFKYALKFSDMSPADNWQVFETLRGTNLVASGGTLRGVKVPEKLEDEVLDGLPFVELFFKYLDGTSTYKNIKKSAFLETSVNTH